jgi:hypothetical protein
MPKKQKMISLSEKICKHIDENTQILNFSDWVEKQYIASFLMEDEIKRNLLSVRKSVYYWEKQLADSQKSTINSTHKISCNISEKEQEILNILYVAIKEGFEPAAVFARARVNYGIKWKRAQFDKYIKIMEHNEEMMEQ